MPNYRRYGIPGGCYFFTVNLLERHNTLLVDHIDLLRESVRLCKQKQHFHIDAWEVLPDHTHYIWTLPEGNDDFFQALENDQNAFLQRFTFGRTSFENAHPAWKTRNLAAPFFGTRNFSFHRYMCLGLRKNARADTVTKSTPRNGECQNGRNKSYR